MIEKLVKEENPGKFIFLGIEKEFEYFKQFIWSDIEFYPTADFYDVASVINSCPYGMYNSSGPLAVAAALNKLRYVENPMSYILNVIFLNSPNERYF
jgi:hypothetical protein